MDEAMNTLLKEQVWNTKEGDLLIFATHPTVADVKFECGDDGQFIWVAHSRFAHLALFPIKYGHIVKTFKTLNGAKRNFIKSYLTPRI